MPAEQPGRNRHVPQAAVLRHIARANVSYLLPVANGLLVTAGIMNSVIGFEPFYAKDNFNYTRSYMAEFSPGFLFGAGGQYTFDQRFQAGLFPVNGHNHLSHPKTVSPALP